MFLHRATKASTIQKGGEGRRKEKPELHDLSQDAITAINVRFFRV